MSIDANLFSFRESFEQVKILTIMVDNRDQHLRQISNKSTIYKVLFK